MSDFQKKSINKSLLKSRVCFAEIPQNFWHLKGGLKFTDKRKLLT
jgi:hypothetical protein